MTSRTKMYEEWLKNKEIPGTEAHKLVNDSNVQDDYDGYKIIKPYLILAPGRSYTKYEDLEIEKFIKDAFEGVGFKNDRYYHCSKRSDAIRLMRFLYCESNDRS